MQKSIGLNFIQAVQALKDGKCVGITKPGWGADKLVIDNGYIKLSDKDGVYHLHFSDDEVLATDWELVPRPKVKKTVEGWCNVTSIGEGRFLLGMVHPKKEYCFYERTIIDVYIGEPLHITHTYEVEE